MEDTWPTVLQALKDNSAWLIPLVSTIAGSVSGSWWTQRVIYKREKVAAGRAEVRAISRATLLCFSAANAYLALKRQHVAPTVSEYKLQRENISQELNSGSTAIQLFADMKSIPAPYAPVDRLEDTIFSGIAITGRALAAVTDLVAAHRYLTTAIALRDSLISEFKAAPKENFPYSYLGLDHPDGNTDARYADCMTALEQYTDDCIFFSMVAAHDLDKYGRQLVRSHQGRLGSAKRSLHQIDWASEEHRHLLPSSRNYENWTRGFTVQPKWWQPWKQNQPVPLPF